MSSDHRKAAGDMAAAAGLQNTFIKQNGKKEDCDEYVLNGTWAVAWGDPKPKIKKGIKSSTLISAVDSGPLFNEAVKHSLPVIIFDTEPVKELLQVDSVTDEAVKTSLPVKKLLPITEPKKKYKEVLPNGRNKKSMPSFDQWHCRIFPKDVVYPAWRSLTKTATDVANICKAKYDHAAYTHRKDTNGRPVFDFTVSEAENFFKWTRPTFTKAIGLLLEIGFIEYARPGGIVNGNGIKALYRLSDKWKFWEAPERDNSNITKARSSRKQNPCKGALTATSKGTLNGQEVNVTNTGKGTFNDNAYFPV